MDNKKETNKNTNNDDDFRQNLIRSLIQAQLKDIEDNKNNPNFRINQTSEFFINDMKDLIGEENFEKIKKENVPN
jgi:hypothetical protein